MLFSIAYSVAIVESQEVCESYTYLNISFYDAQNCSMYCCGSCNSRYCCSSLSSRLDQKLCTPEDCDGHYDLYGYYYKPPSCYEEFCCGKCESRYCCSYPTNRLNQSTCAKGIPTTKRTTTKSYSSPTTTM